MLILAGVSINALVGDNGVLTQTQYASFLNEMSAVEEAVGIWKAGKTIEALGSDTNAIPTSGMCNATELRNTERLIGEVGYYRIWNIRETKPTTDILSAPSDFNRAFENELVFYPAGVQDLYYLNNEAIGISGNKKYIIDASTGLIYSMTGIGIKGTRVYSSAMAKAVMNGDSTMPLFAVTDVSGSGSGEALAGNIGTQYVDAYGNPVYKLPGGGYVDKDGNPISESNLVLNNQYNEFGFEIISDGSNTNLYKLYNNGELYGKGIKGNLLNNNADYSLAKNVWNEINLPSQIPGVSSGDYYLVSGQYCMYVIDSNKDLWAWGTNYYNRLGLSQAEQIEYTPYTPTKLNLFGKKVYKVIPSYHATWVITKTDSTYELYVAGQNTDGALGVNSSSLSFDSFKKVEFENPEKIISISSSIYAGYATLILTSDQKIYYSGSRSYGILSGTSYYGARTNGFIEILEGTYGSKPNNITIDKIFCAIASNDYSFYFLCGNKIYTFNGSTVSEFKINEKEVKVNNFYSCHNLAIVDANIEGEQQFWYYSTTTYNVIGMKDYVRNSWTRFDTNEYFPSELKTVGIKQMDMTCDYTWAMSTTYILLKNGTLYVSGCEDGVGLGLANKSRCIERMTKVTSLSGIDSIVLSEECPNSHAVGSTILKSGSKYYMTWNDCLFGGERILQPSWIKVADNVKKFNGKISASSDAMAYIDFNNDLYVIGYDSSTIGLGDKERGSVSEFTKLIDYYKGNNEADKAIYDALYHNVEDVQIGFELMMILTKDHNLYVCGKDDGTTSYWNTVGLGQSVHAMVPTKLASNVIAICASYNERMYITGDGKLYTYGNGPGKYGYLPQENPGFNFKSDAEIKMYGARDYGAYIIENYTESGVEKQRVYASVGNAGQLTTTGFNDRYSGGWQEIDVSQYIGDDKVIAFSSGTSSGRLMLTGSGDVYVVGNKKYLGLNSTEDAVESNWRKLDNVGKIKQIASANGENGSLGQYYVLVDEKGTVKGTGFNGNGILGRWVGVDRKSPNSRYKSAFEWVECLELEI